jgi:biotin carboxylase
MAAMALDRSEALRLLILGARQAQRPLFEAAQRLGVDVLVADPDPRAPCFALAEQSWVGDLADMAGLLAFAHDGRIDGVLTVAADFPMPALAQIAQALGLPGPSPEAVRRATHKAAMRAAFEAAGLPSPVSALCESAESLIQAVRGFGRDAIVKPVQSSGGRGVTEVDLTASDAQLQAAYAYAAAHTLGRRGVLAEHCVRGPEYSVEGLVWGGRCEILAVTDKLTSGAPHHVEIGHHQPASLDIEQTQQLEALASAAAQALGLADCALHVEIRRSPEGPVLIECAARAGGGCITSRLVPLSTGVDLMEACIQVALGREPDLRPRRPGGACAVRFLTAEPGTLQVYEGLERARVMPGVVEVETYLTSGSLVHELRDATARCGHVICHCPGQLDEAAVRRAVEQAEAARDAILVRTQ